MHKILKIIKRNGKIVDFDENKIIASITGSAEDICFPLIENDTQNLTNEVLEIIEKINSAEDIRTTSIYEVRSIIYCVLLKEGFKEIAKSYMNTESIFN